MDPIAFVIVLALLAVVGTGAFVAGQSVQKNYINAQIKARQVEAEKQVAEAEARAKDTILKAKDEAIKIRDEAENENKKKRVDLQR